MSAEHILILIGEIGGAATVVFGLFFYLFKLVLRTSFQHNKIESRGYGGASMARSTRTISSN